MTSQRDAAAQHDRDDDSGARERERVSTLELFFDLVFVFTVTQVALIIERGPSWSAVAQAVLELLVIMWMYGGFAWFTNTLGSEAPGSRPSCCWAWRRS